MIRKNILKRNRLLRWAANGMLRIVMNVLIEFLGSLISG